ncbi:MAG: long-chain fatty acid--CoA ligase [Candidatus Hermodarchaeota archaeon]|nr:long-chain fatty acid--CoA ligase [Candidatus Hermodarchaeota archaeon]
MAGKVPKQRSWFTVWPKTVPKSLNYPKIGLWEFLAQSAKKRPQQTAVIHNSQRISYSELDFSSQKFALALDQLGVKKGDRVALFLHNVPEYVISYYGALRQGAVIVPMNPLIKEEEFNTIFSSTLPKILVLDETLFSIATPSLNEFSQVNTISVGSKEKSERAQSFDSLLTRQEGQLEQVEINPNDLAVIQYTGGTTGVPKGAMLSHRNLVANALQNCVWFNWTDQEVVMGTLPLYHSWGACVNMNSVFAVGATLLLFTRFSINQGLEALEREKATVWYGPPTLFTMLVNNPKFSDYDLSSLRYVKIGAAPIPEEIRRQWVTLTGGVSMVLGYGLTEACPETISSPPEDIRPGTVGIPIIDTDAKIVDIETGRMELPADEPGELILHGPQVMQGYWKDPAQTKFALRDGWLFTGDMASIDKEGYVTIRDRLKNTIKYKGYTVFPAEVENVLYKHPSVKECCVIGKPDSLAGEIPKAFIVLKEEHNPTPEKIIEFCQKRIAPFKRIREVEFVDSLPKTAVGKILARELREQERKRHSETSESK